MNTYGLEDYKIEALDKHFCVAYWPDIERVSLQHGL